MSNVMPFPLVDEAVRRSASDYVSEWSRYYSASRALFDKETAMSLADSHVAYLKKRDADILAAGRNA